MTLDITRDTRSLKDEKMKYNNHGVLTHLFVSRFIVSCFSIFCESPFLTLYRKIVQYFVDGIESKLFSMILLSPRESSGRQRKEREVHTKGSKSRT